MRIRWLLLGLVVVALVAPALVLTGTRLFEPSGGLWIQLVSFTPHAIVLYTLALLLLLVAVVAGRGAGRRTSAWLSVLVLPFLALHLFWVSSLYVGSQEASDGEGETFTVMSANLSYGDADPARVVELTTDREADVVVLLEITDDGLEDLREAGLGKALPNVAGAAAGGVFGTMVFSRYPLSEVTALETKFAGFSMRVRLPAGTIDLVAAHPVRPMGDAAAWQADHATIRSAAVSAIGPTVIAGDLNATLDHQPIRELQGRGFQDAAELANSGWQPTWPASGEESLFGVPVPPVLQIDHVLVDDGFSVADTEAVSIQGTDHRAVFATLALR
jgi:endonuclease/exonuclease/phosphatase (EEP) superfamily protein YafD